MSIYYAWCPDDGETREDARALEGAWPFEAEDAAEEWARCNTSVKRGIVTDGVIVPWTAPRKWPATVHVEHPDGTVSVWRVEVKAVPVYRAREVTT